MKKYILLILIFAFCFSISKTEDFDATFKKANEFYQKGDYLSAIDNYKKIVKQGYESADVWFNLGNCYYKLNKTADAIISLERAKLLSPNDEDIDFNLKIANLRTVDRFQTIPQVFFVEWYESIKNMYSSGTWSVLLVVFQWIAAISAIIFYLIWSVSIRKMLFATGLASLVIAFFCLFFASQKYSIEQAKDTAIVYRPSVYVKSSPDEKSTDLFILHEGTKLKILDSVGGWKKIRLANGNLGWLPEKTIEII